MSPAHSSDPRERLNAIDPRDVKPGLDRIRAVLEALDSPHHAYPTAVIGGTNGKGSAAAMLAAIVRSAGYRAGFYTSPHLTTLEERFQISGNPIRASALDHQLDNVFAIADRLHADGKIDEQPSHFELLTAVAFRYFAEAHADLVILEVGLGGRWDATNVTHPRVAVLTPIALDHQEYLGSDLAGIAAEKAAIIPAAGLAVTARQEPSVIGAIRRHVDSVGATLLELADYPCVLRRADGRLRYTFDCVGRMREYSGLEMALPGPHQVENARCAILAAEALDRRRLRISSGAIWAGLRNVHWPGRCEWFGNGPHILLDAAHNPAAARCLGNYLWELRRRKAFDRLHLVLGMLASKDAEGIAAALFPLASSLTATEPPIARSRPAAELLELEGAPERRSAYRNPLEALDRAREQAKAEDLVCVTGSSYLVGAVRSVLTPA